ncbi:hypothetical protein J0H58_38855 [bacterium]|nr:hypothetical protein [bacterium]
MPRRESYRTDDEDDDLRRRAHASGGGIPGWVWLLGGGGVLGVLVVAGLGYSLFTSRQAAVRRDVARVEAVRVEADQRAQQMAHDHDDGDLDPHWNPIPGGPPAQTQSAVTPLRRIADAYRTDPDAADARYAGKRWRVQFGVRAAGKGWVGAGVALTPEHPRVTSSDPAERKAQEAAVQAMAPTAVFEGLTVEVPVGRRVVIEATCAGLSPDPTTGVKLVFTNSRLIPDWPGPGGVAPAPAAR